MIMDNVLITGLIIIMVVTVQHHFQDQQRKGITVVIEDYQGKTVCDDIKFEPKEREDG